MKSAGKIKRFAKVLMTATALFIAGTLWAQHKTVQITHMVTPFGTPQYSQAVAFEEVFKKSGSWINWKAQETPGALYIIRYLAQNRDRIVSGEIAQVGAISSVGIMPFVIEGRPPFDKFKLADSRAAFSMPSFVTFFVTFDPEIKTLKDLEGKKVGISEKSRPFQGILATRPYFGKGLKNWKKIKWQFLGAANSKDALLNNKIDVHHATFMGSVNVAKDGTYYTEALAPGPAVMQLMNSGRKLYFLSWDPKILKNATDFSTDMIAHPIQVNKGAIEGVDKELWGRLTTGIFQVDRSVPDDVIQEMIRVRHEYRKELGRYHATLKLLPENPYPIGTPGKWVHPGVKKAMRNLGIPIPAEN